MPLDHNCWAQNYVVADVWLARRKVRGDWRETMKSSHVCGRTLATSLIAFGIGLTVVPTASADPSDPAQTDAPAPGPMGAPAPGPVGAPISTGAIPDSAPAHGPVGSLAPDPAGSPDPAPGGGPIATGAIPDSADPTTADACKQFKAAMNYAATNYEDFAYDTAGSGDYVDYNNPSVAWDNQPARTALRQAAAAALTASATPGLGPDISAPMQSWSLNATKLLLIMGVHGGGDTLNSTAKDMNTDAHNAQMACAAAGVRA
jgi:hypothetical protein